MINIIKDVELINEIDKYDIILIGTNVYCTLSQGIQRDIALNYPYVRKLNLRTKYGDPSKVGSILDCQEDGEPHIILLYICKGYPPPQLMKEYLDYDALSKCLKIINKKYKNYKIATTLLGCSRFDGNGNRDKVLEIFQKTMTDVDITIYDYFQKSRDEKQKETRKKELEVKAKDRALYYQMVKKRKEEAEKRFKRNGFARY